jgi:hypothetical protein
MKAKRLLVSSFGLVSLLAVLFIVTQERDPVFNGKRFSQYLEDCDGTVLKTGPSGIVADDDLSPRTPLPFEPGVYRLNVPDQSLLAIRTVGTNAFELILNRLSNKKPIFQTMYLYLLRVTGIRNDYLESRITEAKKHRTQALIALKLLGDKASPLASEIVPLMRDPELTVAAMAALSYIRTTNHTHLSSLTNLTHIQEQMEKGDAEYLPVVSLLTLGSFGNAAHLATPFVLKSFESTHPITRGAAALAVARIGVRPEIALPLILDQLPDVVAQNRINGDLAMELLALEEYGKDSMIALPKLMEYVQRQPTSLIARRAKEVIAAITQDSDSPMQPY